VLCLRPHGHGGEHATILPPLGNRATWRLKPDDPADYEAWQQAMAEVPEVDRVPYALDWRQVYHRPSRRLTPAADGWANAVTGHGSARPSPGALWSTGRRTGRTARVGREVAGHAPTVRHPQVARVGEVVQRLAHGATSGRLMRASPHVTAMRSNASDRRTGDSSVRWSPCG
jgi:hypothetical protein